jgi:four helix bundle protein
MNITKIYDLEERTFIFTKNVIEFVNKLDRNLSNTEISKQLIRSAGSIGANYIEANESLGKKDFSMRIKISKKEAKETRYWLKLLICNKETEEDRNKLVQEVTELMKIFGAILERTKNKEKS